MDRKLALTLIIIIAVSSISIIGYVPKALGESGTNVSSQIITHDTTWTQAGSPYTLTGQVGIATGVTLTVDAGVTINLGSNLLIINGTLNAQGSSKAKVTFSSDGQQLYLWINKACVNINNAIFDSTSIQSPVGSVVVNNCAFYDGGISEGSGSATITNCDINGGLSVSAAVVSNNTVTQGITIIPNAPGTTCLLSGNNITNPGGTAVTINGAATVSDNIISGASTGISGAATIQGNLIVNNEVGIYIDPLYGGGIIDNNTIADNSGVGIEPTTGSETINFNNLENNGQFNLVSASTEPTYTFPVNATYNWWGTTDTQAINQSIDDNKNDFNLGAVTFTPFLTTPNPQAPSVNMVLTTPQSSTTSPTPTSSLASLTPQNPTAGTQTKTASGFNWMKIALFIAIAVIAALVIAVVALAHKRKVAAGT